MSSKLALTKWAEAEYTEALEVADFARQPAGVTIVPEPSTPQPK